MESPQSCLSLHSLGEAVSPHGWRAPTHAHRDPVYSTPRAGHLRPRTQQPEPLEYKEGRQGSCAQRVTPACEAKSSDALCAQETERTAVWPPLEDGQIRRGGQMGGSTGGISDSGDPRHRCQEVMRKMPASAGESPGHLGPGAPCHSTAEIAEQPPPPGPLPSPAASETEPHAAAWLWACGSVRARGRPGRRAWTRSPSAESPQTDS